MRKEIIGDCQLYLGDMREVLADRTHCADLLCTDPPYPLESGGNTTGEMGGKFSHENYDNSGYIVDTAIDWPEFMPILYSVLRDSSHAYIMANNRHVQNMLNAAEGAGFRFHNLLVWDKGTATPNRWYMKNLEFTGFLFKGKAKYINDCGSKQLLYVPQESYGDHPTTKPVILMKHYIEQSTQPGEIVIDPFMGSGATGAAAVKSGRRFIGIEINAAFFDLSCRRIEESVKTREYDQTSLF